MQHGRAKTKKENELRLLVYGVISEIVRIHSVPSYIGTLQQFEWHVRCVQTLRVFSDAFLFPLTRTAWECEYIRVCTLLFARMMVPNIYLIFHRAPKDSRPIEYTVLVCVVTLPVETRTHKTKNTKNTQKRVPFIGHFWLTLNRSLEKRTNVAKRQRQKWVTWVSAYRIRANTKCK